MDISLILLIVGFAVVAFLIFKFIKKIIFAVLTLVILVIFIIGGVFGLVYLDYNYLTSQEDFDVKILYGIDDELIFGASIPIRDQEFLVEEVTGIMPAEASELEPENIKKRDNTFIIVIDESLYERILTNDIYYIEGLEDTEYAIYDLSLTKDEVIQILNSEESLDLFLDIMYNKNNVGMIERQMSEPILRAAIGYEIERRGMSMRQIVFLSALSQSIESHSNIISLVEGFKDGDLRVYPDRFTFKLVRMLPVKTITGFLPEDIGISNN